MGGNRAEDKIHAVPQQHDFATGGQTFRFSTAKIHGKDQRGRSDRFCAQKADPARLDQTADGWRAGQHEAVVPCRHHSAVIGNKAGTQR